MIKLAQSLLMMVGVLFFTVPQVVFGADIVRDFISDIEVNENGSFLVTETIMYDFGSDYRHGIFRTLETQHPQEATKWCKKRSIEIDVQKVLFDGVDAKYVENTSSKEVEIKIGDANVTITGVHKYVISYLVQGGLIYTDGAQPELYWNVTGSDWVGPIEKVTVNVSGPTNALGSEQTCYSGVSGTAVICDGISTSTSGTTFITSDIVPGEELTIAQSLDSQHVAYSTVEKIPFEFALIPLMLIFFGFVMRTAYRFHTAHQKRTSIIAQYEPYPGVLPMYSGVVMDGSLDPKDITAGIVYLAQQGFLSIKKTDRKVMFLFEVTDYEVTLLRTVLDAPTSFHEEILSMLFTLQEVGEVTSLAALKKNTSEQKKNYQTLVRLKKAVQEDLVGQGFYENAFKFRKNYVLGVLTAVGSFGYFGYVAIGPAGLFAVVVFSALCAVLVGAMVYRRRTLKGYETQSHLKGFKEFLSVTDTERYKFHNAPENSPTQFMEYLPYAIAFGVEDKWAEVFKDITIPSPGWYDGGTHGAFVATSLTHDLGAFSSSFASSSGTSPSSGGGSSGGGSGGGGGGSW